MRQYSDRHEINMHIWHMYIKSSTREKSGAYNHLVISYQPGNAFEIKQSTSICSMSLMTIANKHTHRDTHNRLTAFCPGLPG